MNTAQLETLLQSDTAEIWSSLFAEMGATCSVTGISQVIWQPGSPASVCYEVDAHWASGETSREYMVLASGHSLPAPACRIEADGIEFGAWRASADPFLPGLAAACDPLRLTKLLASLGYDTTILSIRIVSYRPTRRAVVEIRTPTRNLYLKVVPPRKVETLEQAHTTLARAGLPVARSLSWDAALGWDAAGVVVLEGVTGQTLRSAFERRTPLPFAHSISTILDLLPTTGAPAVAPHSRTTDHARLISAVHPGISNRVGSLSAEVESMVEVGDVSGVHGDLHDAQLMVDRARNVVGLLDIDGVGVGERVDDLGNLLGHLSVLAMDHPRGRQIERYAATLRSGFERRIDSRQLRIRIAASVLGLATGPFRVQQSEWQRHTNERVALAESWLASTDSRSSRPNEVIAV